MARIPDGVIERLKADVSVQRLRLERTSVRECTGEIAGGYDDARRADLTYNYVRDYDPGTGRYVESDPIGLQGGIVLLTPAV